MTVASDAIRVAALAEQHLDEVIFEMGAHVRFAKDEEIFSEGETADLVYQLVGGAVRLTHFTTAGHIPIDVLSGPGDLFGLDSGPEHETTATALTDCLVLVARRCALALFADKAELAELFDPDGVRRGAFPERHLH
jgi:CRP/FNR family nitrogen fixation transcriptional regulator